MGSTKGFICDMNEVRIRLFTPMSIQIITEDEDYLKLMKEKFTEYVPGFQFMPAYKSGAWRGTICMINNTTNSLPYGLLFDLVRFHRKHFKNNTLIIEEEVKDLFRGKKFRPKWDLSLKPYPYQKECIMSCLDKTKGIIRSATASGKSLVIAYIIRTLLTRKSSNVKKVVIIVPSTSLIEQFKGDLIGYGFDSKLIGKVFAQSKEWDTPVTISTWQTLSRNLERVMNYDCVIVDEVHGAKALLLKKILEKSVRAKYRLGFTGTLHSATLDNWNVKSYLGPILREYPSGLLAEQGYISKCTINMLNMEYSNEDWEGTYDEIKDEVFTNPFRMALLRELTKALDHNVLLLVGKVEKEGEVLKEVLKGIDKEVVFLSGKDSVEEREKWRKKCMNNNNIALCATYGIFQQGINIPNQKYIVLASPFKSKIRVLQSVGRSLRKHADKEDGAIIFDIHDHTKHFDKHGDIRVRHYDSERFAINEYLFQEGLGHDIDEFIKGLS